VAFTYQLTADDAAVHNRSLVRLVIGDTIAGEGPRVERAGFEPDDENDEVNSTNFKDAELDTFLELEDNRPMRAAAFALEILSNEWAAHAQRAQLGPASTEMRQSNTYAQRAREMRAAHGRTMAEEAEEVAQSGYINWTKGYHDWLSYGATYGRE
jgi:hypothetical protein